VSLTVMQHNNDSSFENKSGGEIVGSGNAKLVRDDGLIKTIELIPLQTGQVSVEIAAVFADGGISRKNLTLAVIPTSKGIKAFHLHGGFRAISIVLEDKDTDRRVWLSPEVRYSQLDYPIRLTDSTQIELSVEQSESNPVIQLDANGMVHGLRPGRARINATFGGIRDSIVVDVYTKDAAPAGSRRIQH
jgi:hypothetical protein